MKRMLALVVAAIAGVGLLAACSTEPDPTPTSRPTATATASPTATPEPEVNLLTLVSGWYQDKEVRYYDFGANTPLNNGVVGTAPIYAFIYGMNADGTPEFVPGQHNIVDVVPGDAGYSDLWQVMLVTVPRSYEADSIRSVTELSAAGHDITGTDIFVNCPIVPENTELEGGESLTQGWHDGEAVFYPDFGPNPPEAAPIWAFITGMDAQGAPQFVEGQKNIIDVVPGDEGYSAFWQVNLVTVPASYVANTITSRDELMAAGHDITATDILVNCPVTFVAAS